MDNMLHDVIECLKVCKIDLYRIKEEKIKAEEIYFVGKHVDMRRKRDTTKYTVTVFVDYILEGVPMRGDSMTFLYPDMTKQQICEELNRTVQSASKVKSDCYGLPDKVVDQREYYEDATPSQDIEKMAEALYAGDNREDAEICYSEFYAEYFQNHMIASNGLDVKYDQYTIRGEFAVRNLITKDVEVFKDFLYHQCSTESIRLLAEEAITMVLDRGETTESPKTGEYPVIFTEHAVFELLRMYLQRGRADTILPGYSNYKKGMQVQKAEEGEELNLSLRSSAAYSDEGIRLSPRSFIKKGILQSIHGRCRESRLLKTEVIGEYFQIECQNGSKSLDEMKNEPYLMPVIFSDFIMDGISGDFGGEIRLAYYFDGKKVSKVTGGSVNGNLDELQGHMVFSKERYQEDKYYGPYALRLSAVQVSGR